MSEAKLIESYRSCLLNTCVRYAREHIPGLSLTNCLNSAEFKYNAKEWLKLPFFVDMTRNRTMAIAHQRLLGEMGK